MLHWQRFGFFCSILNFYIIYNFFQREVEEARKRKNPKSVTTKKRAEKKPKLDGNSKPQTPTESDEEGPDRHGLNTEGGVEDSAYPTESDDEWLSRPYLAQIPKFIRNHYVSSKILDKIYLDDCNLVELQYFLPKIPPRFTIDDIITNVSLGF